MKKILLLAVALSFVPTWAQAELRIGTVRIAEVLRYVRSSDQWSSAESKMQAEFGPRAESLQERLRQFQKDAVAFKRDEMTMSEQQALETRKELGGRELDLKSEQERFVRDQQRREQELLAELTGEIKVVVEAVARDGKYDLVLQDPLYVIPDVDLTEAVIRRLRKN